jgi:hypothetical protein
MNPEGAQLLSGRPLISTQLSSVNTSLDKKYWDPWSVLCQSSVPVNGVTETSDYFFRMYLFIFYNLFNNIAGIACSVGSNGGKYLIVKCVEGSGRGLSWALSWNFSWGTKENNEETLSQRSVSDRFSNRIPPEHIEALPLELPCSVSLRIHMTDHLRKINCISSPLNIRFFHLLEHMNYDWLGEVSFSCLNRNSVRGLRDGSGWVQGLA